LTDDIGKTFISYFLTVLIYLPVVSILLIPQQAEDDMSNALKTCDGVIIQEAFNRLNKRMLLRRILFCVVTVGLNIISWCCGIIFSAIYPKSAINWINCSVVLFIISYFVFEPLGYLMKTCLRAVVKKYRLM
jgi:hypothetical protein